MLAAGSVARFARLFFETTLAELLHCIVGVLLKLRGQLFMAALADCAGHVFQLLFGLRGAPFGWGSALLSLKSRNEGQY
jgi:hypothetical protein